MENYNAFANCDSKQCDKYENCKRAKSGRQDNIHYWYYCEDTYRFYEPITEEKVEETKSLAQEGL